MSENMSDNERSMSESTSESDSTTTKSPEELRRLLKIYKKQNKKKKNKSRTIAKKSGLAHPTVEKSNTDGPAPVVKSSSIVKKSGLSHPAIEKSNPGGPAPVELSEIAKPNGKYINIPKTLKLSTELYNSYKSSVRDLTAGYIDVGVRWENQDKRIMLKLIEKFRGQNPKFPKTVGNWAERLMFRRSINNKRAHKKRNQKKMTDVDNEEEHQKQKGKKRVRHDDEEEERNQKKVTDVDNEDGDEEELSEVIISDNEGGKLTKAILKENNDKARVRQSGRIAKAPRKDYKQ